MVNGSKIEKDKVHVYLQMGNVILEKYKEKNKVMEYIIIEMVMFTKEIGNKIKGMVLEQIGIIMDKNMLEIGKIIKNMDKENSIIQINR